MNYTASPIAATATATTIPANSNHALFCSLFMMFLLRVGHWPRLFHNDFAAQHSHLAGELKLPCLCRDELHGDGFTGR